MATDGTDHAVERGVARLHSGAPPEQLKIARLWPETDT